MSVDKYLQLEKKYKKNMDLIMPISCGAGWYDLVAQTIEEILKIDSKIKFQQIKEKYGELRIYVNKYILEVDDIIDVATKKSTTICEVCGNPGKSQRIGLRYYQTLCNECFSKYNY